MTPHHTSKDERKLHEAKLAITERRSALEPDGKAEKPFLEQLSDWLAPSIVDHLKEHVIPKLREELAAATARIAELTRERDESIEHCISILMSPCETHTPIIKGISFREFQARFPAQCSYCLREENAALRARLAALEWTTHTGGPCPVAEDTLIEIESAGSIYKCPAGSVLWVGQNWRYRIL